MMDLGSDEFFYQPNDLLSQVGVIENEVISVIEPLAVDEENNDNKGGVEKPYLDQKFDTLDDVYNFYNFYALHEGFGIRKGSSGKSQVTGELIWKRYLCDKAGMKDLDSKKADGSEVIRRCRDTRVGCMAKIDVRQRNGKWIVTKFVEEHNHTLDTPRRASKHHSHDVSHKNPIARDLMSQFHGCGMGPSRIARAINAASGNTSITPRQVIDHLREHRMNNVGGEGALVAMHFQKQRELDPNFYFAIELDSNGTLRSMFWADSRSRNEYFTFGDVIVFDVTYKTNKFMMPFAPFTGVNHHRQCTLFGCALLADETEETFVWLFRHWLTCMLDKAPGAIITDMDGAMRNAIKRVFPNTRHRFCSWHIHKHLVENIHALRDNESEFSKDYNKWFKSKNVNSSESRWQALVEKYHIEDKSWLTKMWDLRLHWVPVFLKDTFVAGMTSSGRSESINSFFDGFVNSNTRLHEFVEQYDKALLARHQAEEREDYMTMNSKAVLIGRTLIEAQAGDYYTRVMFKLFQEEFKDSLDCWYKKLSKDGTVTTYIVGLCNEERSRWCTVVYDEFEGVTAKCDCAKFETDGYLCKHILRIMDKKQLNFIPERYILKRWTIGARYVVDSGVSTSKANMNEVTPIMKWCLTALANKAVDKASSSISTYGELNSTLNGFLGKFDQLSLIDNQVTPNGISEVGSTALVSNIPGIFIRDPEAVRTKGRPKVASRIPSGIEATQTLTKKRKCGSCGDKGHYATTCPNKAMMPLTEEDM